MMIDTAPALDVSELVGLQREGVQTIGVVNMSIKLRFNVRYGRKLRCKNTRLWPKKKAPRRADHLSRIIPAPSVRKQVDLEDVVNVKTAAQRLSNMKQVPLQRSGASMDSRLGANMMECIACESQI